MDDFATVLEAVLGDKHVQKLLICERLLFFVLLGQIDGLAVISILLRLRINLSNGNLLHKVLLAFKCQLLRLRLPTRGKLKALDGLKRRSRIADALLNKLHRLKFLG